MKYFTLFLIIAISFWTSKALYGQCTGALTVPVIGSSTGVNATTRITTQPTSQVAIIGTSFSLTVVAIGTNLSYQWQKDGNNLIGETNASYTKTAAANDVGDYTVVVHGSCGADILSNIATVTLGGEIKLAVKVILEGAYDATNGLMRDVLRANNKLPTSQPYEILTFSGTTSSYSSSASNHTGKEMIEDGVLTIVSENAVVDWVLIELRSEVNRATIVASRAALLQRDGDIVDMDGVSAVTFPSVPLGKYHVAIRHRLHLPIRTANVLIFTESSYTTPMFLDFTTNTNALTNGMKQMTDDKYALFSGDVDRTSSIISSDISQVRAILNTPLSNFNYYTRGFDLDMNGIIISSDISICRNNLNKLVPLNQ